MDKTTETKEISQTDLQIEIAREMRELLERERETILRKALAALKAKEKKP